uniref:Uncharacterized protein n=1 Tax=Candidatus Kentrum sp. FW TaxID=2126338 RepID=A0A450U3W2_9GAMM|nr:MAG: hypothetical protein BECKFW1821C_GA0114237_11475 [Candidatus Kentron sp. FW]
MRSQNVVVIIDELLVLRKPIRTLTGMKGADDLFAGAVDFEHSIISLVKTKVFEMRAKTAFKRRLSCLDFYDFSHIQLWPFLMKPRGVVGIAK